MWGGTPIGKQGPDNPHPEIYFDNKNQDSEQQLKTFLSNEFLSGNDLTGGKALVMTFTTLRTPPPNSRPQSFSLNRIETSL